MDIVSCDGCGLLYDRDKMKFPSEEEMEYSNQRGIDDVYEWDGDNMVPVVQCSCGENIRGKAY